MSSATDGWLHDVDAYARAQTGAEAFAGAVLIAQDGRTRFERAYGLADRERNQPNTLETRFNLGSVDKYLTKISIHQFVEAGRLSLDDRVGTSLPDYPNVQVRATVTVRQLLEMTGGLPDVFNERYAARRLRLRTTDDYLALFADKPLRFQPGERTEYSNGGYVLLGKIVERLSDMSYADYVRTHITGPLGMTSTSLDARVLSDSTAAVGYTRTASSDPRAEPDPTIPLHANDATLPARGSSAGGGYSTVRDFARLDAALRRGELMGPSTADLFFGSAYRAGTGRSGWVGGMPGANSVYVMWPDGTTVIIFANLDPPAAEGALPIVSTMLGKT